MSAIGLGCMGMSQAYGVPDPEESVLTLQLALDRGITFFDTADVYGGGANERLIAPVLKPHRQSIVLATKCGLQNSAGGPVAVNGRPDYIRSACDASLERLQTEVIDLYYLHRIDPQVPVEDSMGAMADLVGAGKVRFVGLSEVAAPTLRRAHRVHPVTAVQSEYSLFSRDPEAEVLPACRELGVGFVPFSPLGRGFLTGTLTSTAALPAGDMRRSVPRFQDAHVAANMRLVARLGEIARAHGCTTAQAALAWVLAQGNDVAPIPGTKRRSFLEENIAATGITLSDSDMVGLNELFEPGAASGERYSQDMMRLVDRG